jgi:hypothetical protein
MKKNTILSGLLLLAGLAAQAQDRVTEYNVRPAVALRTPLQSDSINFTGEKFTVGNLLKTWNPSLRKDTVVCAIVFHI